jgi:hypothetical protein
MYAIRNHIATRALCLLMAVHILNFSVDAPPMHLIGDAENLYFNDMESIAEWTLEGILELEDFFPEYQDGQQEDNAHTFKPFKVLSPPGQHDGFPDSIKRPVCLRKRCLGTTQKAFLAQGRPEIVSPPPDLL